MAQVTTTVDVDALLPSLAATVAQALRLDFVAIDWFDRPKAGAVSRFKRQAPPPRPRTFRPLTSGDGEIGRLTLGWQDGPALRARESRRPRRHRPAHRVKRWGWFGSPTRCADRAWPSCRLARRSGGASGATCTTGSATVADGCRDGASHGRPPARPQPRRSLDDGVVEPARRRGGGLRRRGEADRARSATDGFDHHGLAGVLTEFVRSLYGVRHVHLDLPVRRASPPGRGRGGHVPDRDRSADQRRPPRRGHLVPAAPGGQRPCRHRRDRRRRGDPRPASGQGSGWPRCANEPPSWAAPSSWAPVVPHGTQVHAMLPLVVDMTTGDQSRGRRRPSDLPAVNFSRRVAAGDGRRPSSSARPPRATDVAELVATTQPDVVLLDVHLPDRSGLDVNRGSGPRPGRTSK